MRFTRVLFTVILLSSAAATFAAQVDYFLKIGGVAGESRAAGHEGWIELSSVQFSGNACTRDASSGPLKRVPVTATSMTEQLNRACASGAPLGTVTLDVKGQRHVLQNARFAECPTAPAGSKPPTLQLEYTSCSTHGAGPKDIAVPKSGGDAEGRRKMMVLLSNAQPVQLAVREVILAGGTVTVHAQNSSAVVSLGKLIRQATAQGTVFPTLVLQSAGQEWSFRNAKVTSANFPTGQDAEFTFQFESMTGSPAAALQSFSR
jgi:hypothetical protein